LDATSATPHLDAVLTDLEGLKFLHEPVVGMRGAAYDVWADHHIGRLVGYLGSRSMTAADAVEAFVEMTFDVMKMQQEFYETGRFSMDMHGGDLYSDEDIMGRRYLVGLYLAQALWPNHYSKISFFEREMLAGLSDGARVLDVGCGPGTYGLALGRAIACAELTLLDISPLSEPMVLGLAAIDPPQRQETMRFVVGDFLEPDDVGDGYDAIVFSEIVEHLAFPERGMGRLVELLADDGRAFFSTATNSAFYDHTIVFSHLDEIRELLQRHGLDVVKEHTMVAMPGPDGEDRDVVDYSAVVRRVR
jgi:2-polyprenyl-3-methyl-5-hydroxy-6-metoxy-1,4-benzoquinol methylase